MIYSYSHLNRCAGVAQSVEQLIRNQQVMCSSHTTSSKKHRKLRFSVLFCCKNAEMVWVKMWVNRLTHTVTHTTNYPDRSKEYRRGGFCLLSGIFVFFCLHDLCHEAAHFLADVLYKIYSLSRRISALPRYGGHDLEYTWQCCRRGDL